MPTVVRDGERWAAFWEDVDVGTGTRQQHKRTGFETRRHALTFLTGTLSAHTAAAQPPPSVAAPTSTPADTSSRSLRRVPTQPDASRWWTPHEGWEFIEATRGEEAGPIWRFTFTCGLTGAQARKWMDALRATDAVARVAEAFEPVSLEDPSALRSTLLAVAALGKAGRVPDLPRAFKDSLRRSGARPVRLDYLRWTWAMAAYQRPDRHARVGDWLGLTPTVLYIYDRWWDSLSPQEQSADRQNTTERISRILGVSPAFLRRTYATDH